MDFLQRDLNVIANDKEKFKRKAALDRVTKILSDSADSSSGSNNNALDSTNITTILRTCVKSLEDPSEACRSSAVELLDNLLPKLGDDGPDWLFPVLASRMLATGDNAEPSEEQRLDVFNLSLNVMRKYKYEIGQRGFISTIAEIIGAGLKDKFPDLLKAACKACVELCDTEPKGVKTFAQPLAKFVKQYGLQHKHSSIRVEAVKAFAKLVKHGAAEMLADTKDELDNRTTIFYISILAHDHTESVRRTTLDMMSTILLDITDRTDQHRRVIPIVLAMTSDASDEIRDKAIDLLHTTGKLYKIDHEDNRIDLEKRRISVKDIEWYGDDSYPNMTMNFKTGFNLPDLNRRPDLGARLVVAECVRHFLDKTLADLTAVEWLIPFSAVSRRIVALRTLNGMIWYLESNIVQWAEQILGALFKTLLHEDAPVRKESQFSVELLGKFLTPQYYLPILLRRDAALSEDAAPVITASSSKKDAASPEESTSVVRRGNAVVTTTTMDADADPTNAPLPTLFQCAATSTKRGILTALRCLLLGTGKNLGPDDAKKLVQALTDPDVLDLDSPQLVLALCEAIDGLIDVLIIRDFISSPSKPLSMEVRTNPKTRTLDSMLFVVLLSALSCPVEKGNVVGAVKGIIDRCSEKITGTKNGWFDLHCHRIVHRHSSKLAPESFSELMNKTADLSALGEPLTNLFVGRLSNVNYALRVVDELKLLGELRKVLSSGLGGSQQQQSNNNNKSLTNNNEDAAQPSSTASTEATTMIIVRKPVEFTAKQLELLIRSVILYHLGFVPGGTSHLFRKEALHCLREILRPERRAILKEAFAEAWEETNDARVTPTPLSEKIVSAWLSMVDNDDHECRLTCVEMIFDICMMPLSPGLASETLVHMLNRLDDNLDPLRLLLVQQLYKVLMSPGDDVAPAFVNEVQQQLATMTRKLLLHLDDHRENIGIKPAIRDVLKRMCGINCQLVHSMTREVRTKHSTTQYCDEILEFSPAQ